MQLSVRSAQGSTNIRDCFLAQSKFDENLVQSRWDAGKTRSQLPSAVAMPAIDADPGSFGILRRGMDSVGRPKETTLLTIRRSSAWAGWRSPRAI